MTSFCAQILWDKKISINILKTFERPLVLLWQGRGRMNWLTHENGPLLLTTRCHDHEKCQINRNHKKGDRWSYCAMKYLPFYIIFVKKLDHLITSFNHLAFIYNTYWSVFLLKKINCAISDYRYAGSHYIFL